MRVLLTGCSGFIGSNFVHLVVAERPDWDVINLDLLTYAGNRESTRSLEAKGRYQFVQGDICDAAKVAEVMQGVDLVIHFAAESHVDRSILDPGAFVRTNVLGTQILLDASRAAKVRRFVMVSTDEVYGTLGDTGLFTEETPLSPNSPYSASKTGGDLLVRAYFHTYHMDVVTTRCSNNYGPYQFPEKFVPLQITRLLQGGNIPVYGQGTNVRDWLHVEDHCRGILLAAEKGLAGEVYNIGGSNEWRNIDIARKVLEIMGLPESRIEFVKDRPGHDLRYAIDATKIRRELGWEPKWNFVTGLPATIEWYKNNESWWKPLQDLAKVKR